MIVEWQIVPLAVSAGSPSIAGAASVSFCAVPAATVARLSTAAAQLPVVPPPTSFLITQVGRGVSQYSQASVSPQFQGLINYLHSPPCVTACLY